MVVTRIRVGRILNVYKKKDKYNDVNDKDDDLSDKDDDFYDKDVYAKAYYFDDTVKDDTALSPAAAGFIGDLGTAETGADGRLVRVGGQGDRGGLGGGSLLLG